ncbi:hypothetical protein [uncultured Anaerovibrio sp.]|uniref:hypothetical protein n=1 Tax=uncultured Anaerovibrio sp. TaxID=361586 RepID=UPI0025EB47A7|nr:hypothetical protein [uncultured Anaerovibrio sp.]
MAVLPPQIKSGSSASTGPIVGTGQNTDSRVWVLLAGSILCCSGPVLGDEGGDCLQ